MFRSQTKARRVESARRLQPSSTHSSTMTSVAYLWSPELQRAADGLPANTGRSSLVHGLIHALGLLKPDETEIAVPEEAHATRGGEGNEDVRQGEGEEKVREERQADDKSGGRSNVPHEGQGENAQALDADEEDDDEDDEEEPPTIPIRGIRVVAPDPSLGTREELRRYHEQRYVGESAQAHRPLISEYITQEHESGSEEEEEGSDGEDEEGGSRRKRRRTAMGLEDVSRKPQLCFSPGS